MAWNDAPPTAAELNAIQPKGSSSSWMDAPPSEDELKKLGVGKYRPGADSDNPATTDVFGSDMNRTASSFGNDSGIAKLLSSKGYVNAQRNKAGDLVFQTKSGDWHKDANNFTEHPINWAESKIGGSLPVLGMGAGGVAGAGAAGPGGAMIGGGVGAAAGEGLRQAAGRSMGVYDGGAGESADDISKEGMAGILSEAGGQVVNKFAGPYVSAGLDSLGQGIKAGVSRGSSLLTGVPKEAIERLIERPSQVLGASAPRFGFDTAQKADAEAAARDQLEKSKIRDARDLFRSNFGDTETDTSPLLQDSKTFRDRNSPNSDGVGALSSGELKTVSDFERKNLMTRTRSDAPDPNARFSEPVLSQNQIPLNDPVKASAIDTVPEGRAFQPDGEFSSVQSVDNDQKKMFPWAKIPNEKIVPSDASPVRGGEYVDTPAKVIPGGEMDVLPTQKGHSFEGWDNSYPTKSAADLHKFADYLDSQVQNFQQNRTPGTGDTRYQARLRQLYGQVKGLLHEADPDGLGEADKAFSQYADHAANMKSLADPSRRESFINNLYGKNKSAVQDSAEEILPNTMEDLKDMGASRAFTAQGPAGSDFGRRMYTGVAAGSGVASLLHGSPTGIALGGLTAASTSPQLNKAVIGRGAQMIEGIQSAPWFKLMQKNPELIQSVANPELRKMIQNALGEGGQMIPQFAGEGQSTEDRKPSQDYMHQDDAKDQFLKGN